VKKIYSETAKTKRSKEVYMDNAATTPLDEGVLNTMLPFLKRDFGNGASLHTWGRTAGRAIEVARKQVAKKIGADKDEIYFTSGATEANNWILNAYKDKGKIVVSRIEHPSIIETCQAFEKEGIEVEYIDVDEYGQVQLGELEKTLKTGVALVSIMMANNEVGTIQPIAQIAELCKQYKVPFHTDATQAVGKMEVNVKKLGIDALSFSSHKLFGPKGAGALYVRKELLGLVKRKDAAPLVNFPAFIRGGFQETGLRGGTQNTAAIVGFGTATEIDHQPEYVRELRDYMIQRIENEIPNAFLNGPRTKRLCNNVNFSFKSIEGESILIMLDFAGIAVSTGSACSSVNLEPSYVLFAMGVDVELSMGSVRFTLSKHNTREEVDYVVNELKIIVEKLRAMSPLE